MPIFNLKTTLNAFPKLSPSVLANYVTKTDLTDTLANYVTEAPVDDNVYARSNKAWVEIQQDTLKTGFYVIFGASQTLQIDTEQEIWELDRSAALSKDETTYALSYNQTETGFLWIVSTRPIKSIIWGAMGMIADYIEQPSKVQSATTDAVYYCYRIRDMLLPNQWVFTLNF